MATLLHLYVRVLRLLGSEARLGWLLAAASLLLAVAQFAAQGTSGELAARGGRFTALASAQFMVAAS
jgi:hypothetical protein